MAYLEEFLPEFRKGAKIRQKDWDDDVFIYFYKDEIYWKDSGAWKDGKIASTKDLVSLFTFHRDDWEFYQEPIDWDYIIKNKCPCWFYNGEDDEIIINTLNDIIIDARNNMQFFDGLGKKWENCRPVRKYEVTFYEDREK